MAERTTIARPYATAVFDLAVDDGDLPRWNEQLRTLAELVAIPAVGALIAATDVSGERRAAILTEACGDALDPPGRNLVRLLSENKRLGYLPEILAEYARLRAQAEATIDVKLWASTAIDVAHQASVEAALKRRLGRAVRLHCVVDESLVGGAVIRAGDLVIDGSIRGKLERLAAAMSH
ncbi:MAG: F0F1 ATP synthase subunit delta [Steroidobacteraceae bacterium]